MDICNVGIPGKEAADDVAWKTAVLEEGCEVYEERFFLLIVIISLRESKRKPVSGNKFRT
jgi:hypothetical protein